MTGLSGKEFQTMDTGRIPGTNDGQQLQCGVQQL